MHMVNSFVMQQMVHTRAPEWPEQHIRRLQIATCSNMPGRAGHLHHCWGAQTRAQRMGSCQGRRCPRDPCAGTWGGPGAIMWPPYMVIQLEGITGIHPCNKNLQA